MFSRQFTKIERIATSQHPQPQPVFQVKRLIGQKVDLPPLRIVNSEPARFFRYHHRIFLENVHVKAAQGCQPFGVKWILLRAVVVDVEQKSVVSQIITHFRDVFEVLRLDNLTTDEGRINAHLQQLLPPTAIRILANQFANQQQKGSKGRAIEPGRGIKRWLGAHARFLATGQGRDALMLTAQGN